MVWSKESCVRLIGKQKKGKYKIRMRKNNTHGTSHIIQILLYNTNEQEKNLV